MEEVRITLEDLTMQEYVVQSKLYPDHVLYTVDCGTELKFMAYMNNNCYELVHGRIDYYKRIDKETFDSKIMGGTNEVNKNNKD